MKIVSKLSKLNLNIIVITKKSSIPKQFNFKNNISIENNDCLPTMTDYVKKSNHDLFFKNLLNEYTYKIVISDNYIEPSFFSKKAYIFANFIWQFEVIPKIRHKSLIDELHQKMSNNTILMHNRFRCEYIDGFNSFNYELIKDEKERKNKIKNNKFLKIFVAKGFGNWSKFLDRKLNKWIIDLQKQKKDILFIVDKTINIPLIKKKYIRKLNKFEDFHIFDYNIIIGRPSMGILTLALSNKVPFIPLFDKDDKECINNHKLYINKYPYIKNIRLFNKKNIKLLIYKSQKQRELEDGLGICIKKIMDGLINENFSNNSS